MHCNMDVSCAYATSAKDLFTGLHFQITRSINTTNNITNGISSGVPRYTTPQARRPWCKLGVLYGLGMAVTTFYQWAISRFFVSP